MLKKSRGKLGITRFLFILGLVSLLMGGWPTQGLAKKAFEVKMNTATETSAPQSYDTVDDMLNMFQADKITDVLPGYQDPFDPLNGDIDFRGLPMAVTSAAGSTDLTLTIPATGLTKTFSAGSRDASWELLKDWLKTEGGGELDKLFRKLAELTPVDPLAGNPNSLMARMAGANYDVGFFNQVSLLGAGAEAAPKETKGVTAKKTYNNLKFLSARYGSYNQKPYNTNTCTLPLGYAIRFEDDPRHMLTFSLPLSFFTLEGASSYSLGAGVGYSQPLTPEWVLTPAANYGMVFSNDLGSGGQIASCSLTSAYSLPVKQFMVSMGNMLGYYTTLPFSASEIKSDPGISNTVLRNGLMAFIPTEMIYKDTGVEVFFTDTRYFGSALYNDSYEEIGFSYGFTKRHVTDLRLGLTYTIAKKNNGFMLNFGYVF